MTTVAWKFGGDPVAQLEKLLDAAGDIGILVVEFKAGADRGTVPWEVLRPWTRSRAVTVADIAGALDGPALDVALCCDLVYLRRGSALELPDGTNPPTEAQMWAFARAGRPALARGLLKGGRIDDDEAVQIGLAHAVVATGAPLPLPANLSVGALTAARDLMRCRAGGTAGRALELATFRLLFAAGDPVEGARAFLEKRPPRFDR